MKLLRDIVEIELFLPVSSLSYFTYILPYVGLLLFERDMRNSRRTPRV